MNYPHHETEGEDQVEPEMGYEIPPTVAQFSAVASVDVVLRDPEGSFLGPFAFRCAPCDALLEPQGALLVCPVCTLDITCPEAHLLIDSYEQRLKALRAELPVSRRSWLWRLWTTLTMRFWRRPSLPTP